MHSQTGTARPLQRLQDHEDKTKELSYINMQLAEKYDKLKRSVHKCTEPKAYNDMETKAYEASNRMLTTGQVKRPMNPRVHRIR